MLKVWAINTARQRRGLAEVVACQAVLRRTDLGTWQMTLNGNHHVSAMIDKGWRVSVYEDDTFLFSGPITRIRRARTALTFDLELHGVTDMCVLADRMVYPGPATNPGMNNATGTVYTAGYGITATAAENVIVQAVNDHVSAAAPLTHRRYDGVPAMTSAGRGTTVTITARFTNLLTEIQTLARLGGLVVDAGQKADSTSIIVSVRVPADYSQRIRFNSRNGLGDYEVTLNAPTLTTAFAGGAGTGATRDVLGENGPVKWGNRRIERFHDRRDIADGDSGAILRDCRDRYTEEGESATVHFTVTDTAMSKFGRDFLLGDKVTVQTPDGYVQSSAVTTAELEWEGTHRTVRLTLGENVPTTETAPAWVRRVGKIEQTMRRIEGAQ